MKTCHACGKTFRVGRRALVFGAMRHVCLTCSEKALRVCVSVTNTKCTHLHCNETAWSLLDAEKPVYAPDGPDGLRWRVRVSSRPCTHPVTHPTGGGESRCALCGLVKD